MHVDASTDRISALEQRVARLEEALAALQGSAGGADDLSGA